MRPELTLLIGTVRSIGRSRRDLILENLALRHQLAICARRLCISNADRILWALVLRSWSGWRSALIVLDPANFVRWHRVGWRRYWTWRSRRPRYLIRDRDRAYGRDFVARARRIGIETVLAPIRAPQANGVAERWVGTLRRECLDHVIPLSERHLRSMV